LIARVKLDTHIEWRGSDLPANYLAKLSVDYYKTDFAMIKSTYPVLILSENPESYLPVVKSCRGVM
jgi:hypothetical protein